MSVSCLRLVVCHNYLREVEAVCSGEDWSDVTVQPEIGMCAQPSQQGSLPPAAREGECILRVIGCADSAGGNPRAHCGSEQCLHVLAPSALVAHHTAAGAYVVPPGWVSSWPDRLASWGFDRTTASAFFRESVTSIVMLDTGAWPDASQRLQELSEHIGVPVRTVPVGLDCIRRVLRDRVARWRLEQSAEQARKSEQLAARRIADQALAIDLLRQLAAMMTEQEAVQALRDLAALLFGAGQVAFVPDRDAGGPATVGQAAGAACRTLDTGFELRIHHRDESLGLLRIEHIAMMEHRAEYMALAEQIAGLCGLAIANARALSRIRATEEALRSARDAAESASRAKSAFLANMSHEIRTPLNAVIGYAQLLQRDQTFTPEQHRFAETITRSGEHLLSVINSVLEMSKIEAGRATLTLEDCDPGRLLTDVEAMFRAPASERGIALSVVRGAGMPRRIRADAGKIKQVLINLVGNAMKFTDQGGIWLRAEAGREDSEHWRIRMQVEDTGIGVPTQELENVFDAFEQTRAGQKRAGTGLGLTICRQYARLMGGDVTLTSVPGRGSTFTFEFLADSSNEGAISPDGDDLLVARLAPEFGQPRVLVADDRDSNREILSVLLAQAGFVVEEASNGAEALSAFDRQTPDLVIMDMRMPEIDGCEATRQLRKRDRGGRVPVLMVSASALDDYEKLARECGADGFLRKPLRDGALFQELTRLLGVKYLYHGVSAPADAAGAVDGLDPAAVARIPPPLRASMRDALELGYVDNFLRMVLEVETVEPALARALRGFADAYEYSTVIRALSMEVTDAPSPA